VVGHVWIVDLLASLIRS